MCVRNFVSTYKDVHSQYSQLMIITYPAPILHTSLLHYVPHTQSQDVPNWKFIAWISQMVALLDKHEGAAVHSILLSLATDYPQALCYPFKISSSNFKFDSTPEGRANQEAMEK